jgi:hypothetical protein
MMEAVSSYETAVSVNQTTWRNIPEASHLQTMNYLNNPLIFNEPESSLQRSD